MLSEKRVTAARHSTSTTTRRHSWRSGVLAVILRRPRSIKADGDEAYAAVADGVLH